MSMVRVACAVVLAIYLCMALVLTLTPTSGYRPAPNLVPLAGIAESFASGDIGYGLGQAGANLLLLFPLGFLLPAVLPWLRFRWLALVALLLSSGIEILQWWLRGGRMADIDDVWLNVLGALVGYGLGVSFWLGSVSRRIGTR